MPSVECVRLSRMKPARKDATEPGDLWINTRTKSVFLTLQHSKRGRSRSGRTFVFLYHFGGKSLRASSRDLRDNAPNACSVESILMHPHDAENIVYAGNIFDLVPLAGLFPGD